MKQTILYETESMRLRFFFHHMRSAMVQCAPTLVGSALRVVFGPQKSLLDNSRGAGGKNTAPTPHGHRFSLSFITDATCRVTYVTFHISERTMATRHNMSQRRVCRDNDCRDFDPAVSTPRIVDAT